MQCPSCKSPIHMSEPRCPHCGAERPSRRFLTGEERPFELTADDADFTDDAPEFKGPQFDIEPRDLLGNRFRDEPEPTVREAPPPEAEIRWGGFWRRVIAFLIDAVVLSILSSVMALLCLVGYKVGLAKYGRTISWETAIPLISTLT